MLDGGWCNALGHVKVSPPCSRHHQVVERSSRESRRLWSVLQELVVELNWEDRFERWTRRWPKVWRR
jgi:hypothetical protein